MIKCKNCGCEIEGFGSINSYRGIQWYHTNEGKTIMSKTNTGKSIPTEKKACACGCVNPEPETQKNCDSFDARATRVEEAKK